MLFIKSLILIDTRLLGLFTLFIFSLLTILLMFHIQLAIDHRFTEATSVSTQLKFAETCICRLKQLLQMNEKYQKNLSDLQRNFKFANNRSRYLVAGLPRRSLLATKLQPSHVKHGGFAALFIVIG